MDNDSQHSVSFRVSRRTDRNHPFNNSSRDTGGDVLTLTDKLYQDYSVNLLWKKGFLRLVFVGGILWMFLILTVLLFHI